MPADEGAISADGAATADRRARLMPNLTELEQRLGIPFHNRDLLQQAMVHRSHLNENPSSSLSSNERLEFLGDAVLGLVVAEELYRRFPDMPEGKLTRLRAALVCQDGLFKLAERMKLGDFLLLGHGEDDSGGRAKPTNLARALEALIGAICLDQSLDRARSFILGLMGEEINEQYRCAPADCKSQLQEYLHARKRTAPAYRVVETSGPDHDKVFTVNVLEGGEVIGTGSGRTKKAAEAGAAQEALEKLQDKA